LGKGKVRISYIGHEGIWVGGNIISLIPNLGTKCKWVDSFLFPSLHPGEKSCHWIIEWLGTRVGLNSLEQRKICCLCQESNRVTRFSSM